jgi:hypothetical protein
MTKYLVFENQPNSGQVNAPGSREEMACTIAKVVSQDALPKDFYIAFPLENPNSNWDSLKDTAKFSVEIDDERAELWEKEISPLTDLSYAIDDAIGDAYSSIVEAARALDLACEKSKNFQEIKVLENIGMDRAFDNLEHYSFGEISEKVEEIFEVITLN